MDRPSEVSPNSTGRPSVLNTGVRAISALPPQCTAGPYPADIQLGLNTSDSHTLSFYLDVKHRDGKIISEKSEVSLSWMLYVKPARDRHEQNIEAFRDTNGRIFFRSIRPVETEEQLFVWYSDDFAREIGIPALSPENIQGNQRYVCNKCKKNYEYPNPLKAHMRFRCAASRAEILASLYESPPPATPIVSPWLPLASTGNKVSRQLFPMQNGPSDLSPKKAALVSPPRLHKPASMAEVSSTSAFRPLRRGNDAESTPRNSSPPVQNSQMSFRESEPPMNYPSPRKNNTGGCVQTVTSTNMIPTASQPIQIFNHIHPPAIPIPLDHPALKFYYPVYTMHGTSGYCCGPMASGHFERDHPLSTPYPYAADKEAHGHHHHHGTDLRIKRDRQDRRTTSHDDACPVPVTSPLCVGTGPYSFPLPSEKAGEPLDLLPRHLYLSKSRKGHLCIYCGKLYSRKYGLKIHLRTHTGYKPLKCKVCLRPFGDPSNLNKHIRLHAEGDTPYRCEFCGKVLVRRRDLVRHIKSRHPNETSRAQEIEDQRDFKSKSPVKIEPTESYDEIVEDNKSEIIVT